MIKTVLNLPFPKRKMQWNKHFTYGISRYGKEHLPVLFHRCWRRQ